MTAEKIDEEATEATKTTILGLQSHQVLIRPLLKQELMDKCSTYWGVSNRLKVCS